jgi:hypothetical protein
MGWRDLMTTHGDGRLDDFRYRGARALVLLHEQELARFVATWREAKKTGLALSGFDDPNYASLETLLAHVLWWARHYLAWSCESVGLPDPEIAAAPPSDSIADTLDSYLEHLLERWRDVLGGVPEEPFLKPQHTTRWGASLPVEHLLEHAVVHPMRHRLQLLELLEQANNGR